MYQHKVSKQGNKKGALAEMQNSKETGGIEGFLVLGFHLRHFFDSGLHDLKLERVVLREVTSRLILRSVKNSMWDNEEFLSFEQVMLVFTVVLRHQVLLWQRKCTCY
jgi:hypothetical protein